jgi:hypothetical protein
MKLENYSGRDIRSDDYLIRSGASMKKKSLSFHLLPIDFTGAESVVFYQSHDSKHHVIWDYRTRILSDAPYNKISGNSYDLFYNHAIRPGQIILAAPTPMYIFEIFNMTSALFKYVDMQFGKDNYYVQYGTNLGTPAGVSAPASASYITGVKLSEDINNRPDITYEYPVTSVYSYVEGEPNPCNRRFTVGLPINSDNEGRTIMNPGSPFYSFYLSTGANQFVCQPNTTEAADYMNYVKGGILLFSSVSSPAVTDCNANYFPSLQSQPITVINYTGAVLTAVSLGNATGILSDKFTLSGNKYVIDTSGLISPIYGTGGYFISVQTATNAVTIPINPTTSTINVVLVNSSSNFSVYSGNTLSPSRSIQLIQGSSYCVPTTEQLTSYTTKYPQNYIYAMNNSGVSGLTQVNCNGTVIDTPPPSPLPANTPPADTPPASPPASPPAEPEDIIWTVYNYSGVALSFNGQPYPVQNTTTFKSPGLTMSNGTTTIPISSTPPVIYIINSGVNNVSLAAAGTTLSGRMITSAGDYCDIEGTTTQQVYITGAVTPSIVATTENCDAVPSNLILESGRSIWVWIALIVVVLLILLTIIGGAAVLWKKRQG